MIDPWKCAMTISLPSRILDDGELFDDASGLVLREPLNLPSFIWVNIHIYKQLNDAGVTAIHFIYLSGLDSPPAKPWVVVLVIKLIRRNAVHVVNVVIIS